MVDDLQNAGFAKSLVGNEAGGAGRRDKIGVEADIPHHTSMRFPSMQMLEITSL